METITARSNPLVLHIRKLQGDRAYRRACQELVCEGPKLLEEALTHGMSLRTLVYTKEASLPAALPDSLRLVCVPEALLDYMADTKTPQKLLFVCDLPDLAPPNLLPTGRYLALEGLQDPGNLGTIWRTADAFGAEGLFLLPGCADPFAPKTIRAAMGAGFRLPVWESSLEALQALAKDAGRSLVATALREDATDLTQTALADAVVLIGSEGRGLSEAALSACERAVKIPMRSRCESLNAAVAASVILWEMGK